MQKQIHIIRTDDEVKGWYEEHLRGVSITEISSKYNTDCGYHFRKRCFKVINRRYTERKSKITDYFEEIDNEFKAYFMGLLYSDGYISESSYIVSISLNKKDRSVLDKINSVLCPDNILREVRNQIELKITSKEFYDNMLKHGMLPNKTYKNCKIKIPIELLHHFVRGYFDGDGTVFYDGNFFRFNIASIKEKLIQDFSEIFNQAGIYSSINKETREGKFLLRPNSKEYETYYKDMFRVIVRRKADLLLLFDYLYKDSQYFMERKHNLFNQYVNSEVKN